MGQRFKFNILTGDNAPQKYASIPTKDPFTFYLLQTGAGYLGTVKLFDASVTAALSGKYFRAVSSHTITEDDFDNESINLPEGTQIGDVGMLFTADSDENTDGNEIYWFIPVQFEQVKTIDEIDPDNPTGKIPTDAAVINYVIAALADKVSFEIDGVPGGDSSGGNSSSHSTYNDTPIGTVISYVGVTAPKDYLVLDGAEYNIADYPDLANFFEAQFGSSNKFGGDGTTTFAVPDMRNLFLRGYHGDAEEQLSGEIGETQEATAIPTVWTNYDDSVIGIIQPEGFSTGVNVGPLNIDSTLYAAKEYSYLRPSAAHGIPENLNGFDITGLYASRPINMAVLFCIKATKGILPENVYSTEERRIGTWIDGKSVYQRTFIGLSAAYDAWSYFGDGSYIDTIISATGQIDLSKKNGPESNKISIPCNYAVVGINQGKIGAYNAASNTALNAELTVTVAYTKTTD